MGSTCSFLGYSPITPESLIFASFYSPVTPLPCHTPDYAGGGGLVGMSGSEVEMCQLIELELGAARGKAEVEG